MPAQLDTPHKARVLGALQWAKVIEKRYAIPVSRRDIGKVFGVSRSTVMRIEAAALHPDKLADSSDDSIPDRQPDYYQYPDTQLDSQPISWPDSLSDSPVDSLANNPTDNLADRVVSPDSAFLRTRHHNLSIIESRGRKRTLSRADCQKIVDLYDEHGFEARVMPWESQVQEALDQDVSSRTARRAMKYFFNIQKYKAVEKQFVKPDVAKARMAYARRMLERWDLSDWRRVRFSDETHFGWVLSATKSSGIYVSRQPGHRTDPDCVYERPPRPETVEEDRVHCWAAVGYDFKSPLVRYYTANRVSQ